MAGIGITNERETVVLWDRRTGHPVRRSITWQDTRTAAAADALAADGGIHRFQDRTGLPISTYSSALGVDETTWPSATKDHPTLYAPGLVDLRAKVVIDVVEGNSASLDGRLDHAIRVADPFHVVRLANRCLDQVRRRVQNRTLGHRGRKRDPLYRIRKLMLTGTERLEGPGL